MRVIIVHRWDGNPGADWYPWLKKQLEEDGHEVIVPEMPNPNKPEIDPWVDKLRAAVGRPDSETVLIGHSIGCRTIMFYLASLPDHIRICGTIFVAGWFKLQNLEGPESYAIAKPWGEKEVNLDKVRSRGGRMTAFLSDNDPFVDLKTNGEMFKQNLGAELIIEKGKGHYTSDEGVLEMPKIREIIENMEETL
jgi:uncharacterized protein